MNDAHSCYISAISAEKELFVRLIFSELTLSGNMLKFRCKNGFKALERRLVTMGCPTEWLSELDRLDGLKVSIVELEKLLKGR
ncbi:hypothetical protein [Kordiimonas aestuarii]|uniref:hypothetical protein n=1 Tax=Kordiimonas aestuarii TaxID=1005925 RepID=UPI0021D34794|nr:hypothetical protein [Kordiimonas aestuarii]